MPKIVSSPSPDNIYKIILIGDSQTGKTNLLERFEENGKWNGNMRPTVGINFNMRTIKFSDWSMKLQFWDIASDKRMNLVRRVLYRHTFAVFLVYDITNQDSFLHIHNWLREFREKDELGALFVLVGNKCDIENERKVSYEAARCLAEEEGCKIVEVSAKTLENVNYLARLVATDLMNRYVKVEEVELPRNTLRRNEDKNKEDDVVKLKQKNEEKKKSVCAT